MSLPSSSSRFFSFYSFDALLKSGVVSSDQCNTCQLFKGMLWKKKAVAVLWAISWVCYDSAALESLQNIESNGQWRYTKICFQRIASYSVYIFWCFSAVQTVQPVQIICVRSSLAM